MRVKHRSGKGAIPLRALAAFVIAGIACSGKNGDGSEPGPVQVNIITGEGTFEGYWPATLLVTFHNTAFPTIYHLEIEGGRLYPGRRVQAVNDGWRFSAQLSTASRGWLRTDSDRIRGFCLGEPGERTAYRPHHYRRRPRHVRLRAGKGQDFGTCM